MGAAVLLVAGCSPTRSPQAAANYFVDKYYIEIDHGAAMGVSEGTVAERLKAEQGLVATAQSQGVGPTQVLPRVFYTVKSSAPTGSEETRVVYELSIDSGGQKMKKEVTLLVVHHAGGYYVHGWAERDEGVAP